jgi:hypothetical protein
VFGCTCPGQHGIPRRVVFDGNSLSFKEATKALRKPWAASEDQPVVRVLPREVRHPAPELDPRDRQLLRTLVYRGQVQCLPDRMQRALSNVDQGCPGFIEVLEHILIEGTDEGSAD